MNRKIIAYEASQIYEFIHMINCPHITVAIITQKNRFEFLFKLMKSIENAVKTYPGKISFMIIGKDVDNIFQKIKSEFDNLEILYIPSNGQVPDGREMAIQKSESNWVLFVDDDCEVDKEIFKEYFSIMLSNKNEEIGAIYGTTKFSGVSTVSFKACWHTPFIHPFQIANLYKEIEWAPTSNAIFSKKAVLSIGGFDKSIPVKVSGEDVDIGIRLNKADYRCLTCPKSIVYHTTSTWNRFIANTKRFFTYGRSEAWLAVKHMSRRKISWGTLILTLLILLTTYFFEFMILTIIPIIILCWMLAKSITYYIYSMKIPFLSYVISDLYKLSNYAGYIYQVINYGVKFWGYVFFRFKFYKCHYIQYRIKKEGPY